MKKRTFQEQVARIASAYYTGNLNPYCRMHGFIAHLLDYKLWNQCGDLQEVDGHSTALSLETSEDVHNTKHAIYKESQGLYELSEIAAIERKFLTVFQQHLDRSAPIEDALYNALISGVQELKAVHEAKGETCYYEPISKADYMAVPDGGPHITFIRMGSGRGLSELLMAILGGHEEDDETRRHREMLQRQQRFN